MPTTSFDSVDKHSLILSKPATSQQQQMAAVGMKAILNLTMAALLIAAAAAAAADAPPASYTNHTVGGPAGWFFNSTTNTSVSNYSSWASSQTFNLGDYLIFNTNTNQTVVQTYNETTFQSCVTDDSLDNDTFVYDGGSSNFGQSLTIAVPLTVEGHNYYFSDADDGTQCQHGMAFGIIVNRGIGLPPSLNQPPPPPYMEPPGPADGQSPPITINGVGSASPGSGALRNVDPALVSVSALMLAVAALLRCF